MESPLAQRIDRLWMSLLMMVVSSSALRRSLLPPNGSSIDADWSRRKMKHPGVLRLISALYMVAPGFRLLRASLDLARLDLAVLGGLDRGALHRRGLDPGGFDLRGRDVDGIRRLDLRDEPRALDDRGARRGGVLAERPVPQEPAGQADGDQ